MVIKSKPDARLKVFLATDGGAIDLFPDGLIPSRLTPSSVVVDIPCTWADGSKRMGSGFAAVLLTQSTGAGAAVGMPVAGDGEVPTILAIDGEPLHVVQLGPFHRGCQCRCRALAGPEHFVSMVSISINPLLNLFYPSGNCGPITPSTFSDLSLEFELPAGCPVGPGAIMVVNATGDFLSSAAVTVALGEQIAVDDVFLSFGRVVADGTGFSTATVVNFFARDSSGEVPKFWGLGWCRAAHSDPADRPESSPLRRARRRGEWPSLRPGAQPALHRHHQLR